MIINEDFIRCECGQAYFREVKSVLIHKASTEKEVILLKEESKYLCSHCGKEAQFNK